MFCAYFRKLLFVKSDPSHITQNEVYIMFKSHDLIAIEVPFGKKIQFTIMALGALVVIFLNVDK